MTRGASAGFALAAVLLVTTVVWAWSLRRRDVSVIDVFWGPLFALQAWIHRAAASDAGALADAATLLVTLWALRLAVHLARRARGAGEDPRYAAFRAAGGPAWPLRALATVFWLQALLAWVVAWPLAVAGRAPDVLGPVGWAGVVVASVGLLVETVADRQLSRFRGDPTRRGRVLDTGLWRYSRHPNYFGDAVFWWGIFLLAVDAGGAWTVFAPILMTLLLLRVSGVPFLESRLRDTRPGYADYVRRTSAFVPWFPRRGAP